MTKLLAPLLALLLLNPLTLLAEEEPLPPAEAFPMKVTVKDSNTLVTEWKIADGYYLYRNNFSFRTDTEGVQLGEAVIPAGKIKKDPYFGEVETLRGTIHIEIPVTRTDNNTAPLNLISRSQGCADMGLCYPPYEQTASVDIAAVSTDAAKVDPIQAITDLGTNLGLQEDEFLEPDKAFVLSTQNGGQQSLIAHWMIADDYYMYRDKFKFNLKQAPPGISLGEVVLPEGEIKNDEYFGKIQVFHNAVTAQIPIIGDLNGEKVQIELVYQGCAEAGLCYPPIFKTVAYDPAGSSSSITDSAVTAAATTPAQVSTDSQTLGTDEKLVRLFKGDKLFTILITLLGFGLLLAFTACMYPMIPIVSGIIVGHGEKVTAMKGFMLSLVYVLAMAVTFGIIGAIFGFTGEASNIAAQMQKPWVLLLFAALFVALALSMFGFYNIQMPSAIQSRLNEFSNKQKSGSLIGVSIMGVLSALIIGPCGGPILLATIAGAAASNSVFLGFLYMFTLAIGMGLPLLLVGAGGGKLLPRAGGWMNTVKAVAGIVLLAVAIVFLERVVSSIIFMTLWALLFIVSATYMGAFEPVKEGSSGWLKLFKGLGLALFVYGVMVLIGGLTGARNFNDPLHGSELLTRQSAPMMTVGAGQPAYVKFAQGKDSVVKGGLTFIKIKTVADFEAQLKSANAAGKTVMLDFYADWCTYCKQFDDYVFSDPKVQQALADTVLIQADITAQDKADKAVLKKVDVITAPAILFFNTEGEEVRQQRVLGLMSAEKFLNRVNQAFN